MYAFGIYQTKGWFSSFVQLKFWYSLLFKVNDKIWGKKLLWGFFFFFSCRSFCFFSHPVNHLHLHSLWARSVTHSMTLPLGSFGLIYNRRQCFGFPQLVATYFDIVTPFHGSLLFSITEYLVLCLHMTYKHTNGVFTNSTSYKLWSIFDIQVLT